MNEQDEPKRRFIVEKKPVMQKLPEPEHPNLVAGANMSFVRLFGDILRWIDRRRAAKAQARHRRTTDSSDK
jgi:hypothetical protein